MTVAVRTGFVSVTDTVNVPVRGASRLTEAVNVNVASPEPPVGLTVIPLSVSGDIVQSKPGVAITEPVAVLRPSTSISGSASVVLKEEGPDHDKTFIVEVSCDDKFLATGKGKNKKHAEMEAAKNALQIL